MNLVNSELSAFQRLILAYARRPERCRYGFLFALDNRFANMFRTTSETLIIQMKLTWWRDILTMAAADRPKGEPLVALLGSMEEPDKLTQPLLELLDGWEIMLDDFPWSDAQFQNYAGARGTGFFAIGMGGSDGRSVSQSGYAQSWALWDLAHHCPDSAMQEQAFRKCVEAWPNEGRFRFDKSGRPLSILCKLVERDVKKGELSVDLYRPSVAGKIIWHGLTGL